ncbi:DUF3237 domain-containing protein [Amorphus sp. 3PC139-8]|uniref:DUF3237 domain-containing protein n=1 Tax=Amorphus sp. 3PC139-8 TaxID=2735676 RepID=UPI00345DB397
MTDSEISLPAPLLRHLCDFDVTLSPPHELGDGAKGKHRIIPIVGGVVRGERLNGRILPIGADWQTVRGDGVAELDARYAFETDEGAIVEVQNFGLRHGPAEVLAAIARGEPVDPACYYMRTHARFVTADPRTAWLNRVLAIGSGARLNSAVRLSLYEML